MAPKQFATLLLLTALVAMPTRDADGAPPSPAPMSPATRPTPNDPAARTAIRERDAATAKAKLAYDKAVAAADAELVKKLEVRLDALTKAGRLDDALAVRDLIAATKPKPAATTGTSAASTATADAPGSFMTIADAVGTWKEGNGTPVVLRADGRFIYAGSQPGTWRLSEEALVLTWAKGRVDTYNKRDGDAITGDSTLGHQVTITKTRQK